MAYLLIKEESKERLHLARAPSLWSYAILAGLVAFGFGAAYYGSDCLLWKVVYVCGAIFLGLSCLEEWEDCVFDLSSGQVEIRKLSLMQKLLKPTQEQPTVVTELRGIVDVRVQQETIKYFGKGHQVTLFLDTGLSMGVTDACTFGDSQEHNAVAEKIRNFLGLKEGGAGEDEYLGDGSSSDDSFEQIDAESVEEEIERAGLDAAAVVPPPDPQLDKPSE